MNIKKFRIAKKWTQKELAEQLNVSQQTIAKWENNKSFPRGELLPKVALILECEIKDLY